MGDVGGRLAVLVMACNEDNVLGRCLDSVAGLPVFVSVDVKTTDDTMAVADKHRATIYEHEFINNSWADTRNQVMDWAESDTDAEWFLWLDADEWLLAGRELLVALCAAADKRQADGIAVTMRDFPHDERCTPGEWPNVKLLRRGVRYERRRHEVVPGAVPRLDCADVVIGHEKGQRPDVIDANERLKTDLLALLADQDEHGDQRSAFYLADAYARAQEWGAAREWYQQGLRLDKQAGLDGLLLRGWAETYRREVIDCDDADRRRACYTQARTISLRGLCLGADELGEFLFDVGADSLNLEDYPTAEFYLRAALTVGPTCPRKLAGIGSPQKVGALACYSLAALENNRGRPLEASAWLGKAYEMGAPQGICDDLRSRIAANMGNAWAQPAGTEEAADAVDSAE